VLLSYLGLASVIRKPLVTHFIATLVGPVQTFALVGSLLVRPLLGLAFADHQLDLLVDRLDRSNKTILPR
jgi:hypothetical protein